MATLNEKLFKEVKLRERRMKREEVERTVKRNRAAERAVELANEEQRRSTLDIIAKAVPAGDKVHLASNAEYDKIDGFHQKPIGADAILQEMRSEEQEVLDSQPKVNERARELEEIEKQRQARAGTAPGGSSRTELRLDPDDQVPLHGLRPLDDATLQEKFTGEATDASNKWGPLADDDRGQRRNHFPAGAARDQSGKEKVQLSLRRKSVDSVAVEQVDKTPPSQMVGGKYALNDQQVKSMLNKRYNPNGEAINEEISHEKTHDLSPAGAGPPGEPPKADRLLLTKQPLDESEMDYTVAEYSVIGGKKKKKKKKKKRPASRVNMSAVGPGDELKPIAEEAAKEAVAQPRQALALAPSEESKVPAALGQEPASQAIRDPNDPANWRTQEQLHGSFQAYDFEKNGVVPLDYANQALTDSGIVVDPTELRTLLNTLSQDSWEGNKTIDFHKLILKIAKDPPGYVRTGPVAPRYAPREPAQDSHNRSARSNSSSLSRLPPKPKTA